DMAMKNSITQNIGKYGKAGILGKIGMGFVLAIIAAVIVTLVQLVWNSEPVRAIRKSASDWYSGLRNPFTAPAEEE
ncbi:hypothetical protein, partial [Undibacterium sp. RuTC16W]|uniref:hypothetical protein n=1 Tax=Undibacterium sp. RuTC16W TaxID=3413048 RepID=UPI003BF18199